MTLKLMTNNILKSVVIILLMQAFMFSGCNTASAEAGILGKADDKNSEIPIQATVTAEDPALTPEPSQEPTSDTAFGESAAAERGETPDRTNSAAAVPSSYVIQGFPIVYQKPELPTGCEITALTMMLNFYGYDVSKMTMAETYLPVLPRETWKGDDGRIYGPDMYYFFVGDPQKTSGLICGAGAIEAAANAFLAEVESKLQAVDITGSSVSVLYEYVGQGIPVFVCATVGIKDRREIAGSWYTEDGRKMEWASRDHGVVLIGYSSDQVTLGDPISGLVTCKREQFEKVYEQRGSQAVVLLEKE